jgi:hypothetical protein
MPNPKGKEKFLLWAHPETLELVKNNYKKAECKSQSQYIERAIQYYTGRVTAEDDNSYLPVAMLSNMKAISDESDNRISRLLFKFAVEQAMLMNIIAASHGIDKVTLEKLRVECIKEVKRLNGSFDFQKALEWQKG